MLTAFAADEPFGRPHPPVCHRCQLDLSRCDCLTAALVRLRGRLLAPVVLAERRRNGLS